MAPRASVAQTPVLPLFPDFEPLEYGKGKIAGTVLKVLHVNIDTGFSIVRVKTEGGEAVVCGKGDPLSVGDDLEAEGAWETDPTWGRQFRAKFIQGRIPDNAEGVYRFIASGNVPGVGARVAQKLVDFFGPKLPQVMETPTTLMAAGITEQKARQITAAWTMRNRYGRLLSLLYAHRLGNGLATRIIEHYGDATMRVVTTNPYQLAREVRGIGFKIADRIALSQNRPKDAPERIAAAIRHQMETFSREGHCASGRSALANEVSKLLTLSLGVVDQQIDAMLIQGDLVEESAQGRTVIYEKAMRECEIEVAELLAKRLVSNPVPADIETRIEAVRVRLGVPPLHVNQLKAVKEALANSTVVVTGNPGTGKTSTVSVFIAALQELAPGLRISLAAPTGRAAQRLTESTGFEASTLHRLLEWSPEKRGFTRDQENPLELDVLVVDESSMLDIWLTRDLLRALPEHARLVIVGDVDQLPSVGPGNVLADMIASQAVPMARLTHIFRQGDGSAIAAASGKINGGIMPQTSNPSRKSDMWGVFVKEPAEIAAKLEKIVRDAVPQMGYDPLKDLQILSPGHNHESGTVRINQMVQAILNPRRPGDPAIDHKERQFRLRDRVIQVTNDYDRDVFNGDIGNIVEIHDAGSSDERLVVDYSGRLIVYERSDLDQLQHAYCISIHKSQGSEFPVVVVVVTTQHYVMLRRNLIYTGVSRARRLCVVLGQTRALQTAVRSGGVSRLTGLAQRLASLAVAQDILRGGAVGAGFPEAGASEAPAEITDDQWNDITAALAPDAVPEPLEPDDEQDADD